MEPLLPDPDPLEPEGGPLEEIEAASARRDTTRGEFSRQLAEVDRRLVETGTLVADRLRPVTNAFLEADFQAAAEIVAVDAEVDRRCRELEETCAGLIALQSPVSGDLRHLVALLRSIADVERSGDLLRHVAGSLKWVHPTSFPEPLRDLIRQLGAAAESVLRGGLRAWERQDGLAANELEALDDEVDLLQKCLLTELYTGSQSVEDAVSLALLARYYERIADHGVEMARQVSYAVTGHRIEP